MDKENEKLEVVKLPQSEPTNKGLKVFNLLDEKQLAQAEVFLKKIMASDKGGIKSVNEGLAILMRAQDLNLPFSSCIEHIHVINGKTGVDVHIIKSKLLMAGVVWERTKDYTPQYQFTDGSSIYNETQLPQWVVKCANAKQAEANTKDGLIGVYPLAYYIDLAGNVYNELQINDKCVIALNKVQALKLKAENKFPIIRIAPQPIDYVTEFKFTRYKMINGVERVMTTTSKFSLTDAQKAGLIDKDNYSKYPKVMIDHRAFSLGARDIADDLLMGVMETTELKISQGIKLEDADYEIIS